jgi:hypothetical protein
MVLLTITSMFNATSFPNPQRKFSKSMLPRQWQGAVAAA